MARHIPLQRRRTVLAGLMGIGGTAAALPLLGLGLGLGSSPARTQPAWPTKPIRLIVAFAPGSGNDVIARDLAAAMGPLLGQTVIVENRAGGGGAIGTDAVAKAAPDGYTIGLGTSSQLVMNVGLVRNLPFDVERDLRSIGLVSRSPLMLIGSTAAGTPRTLPALIEQAKAHPGKFSYGSAGPGSISHIVAEAFARAAGIQLLHVPYKGNAAAMSDLAGGQIHLVFDGFLSGLPLARQGRAVLLAVSRDQRSSLDPSLPTFAELGLKDYQAYTWNCLFAPAKTPPELIERLNAALNQALATPAIRERLAQSAADALGPGTPAQADAFGQAERARWVPFIRALNIEGS